MSLDQILLFGDSITQFSFEPSRHGFGAELAHDYARRLDVVNRGFSGYNTDWLLRVLPQMITSESRPPGTRICLLVIFLGANDAAIKPSFQHVPIEQYETNLGKLAQIALESDPKTRLIFIGPPPVEETAWGQNCKLKGRDLDRDNLVTRAYSDACGRAAQRIGVPFIDLHTLFMNEVSAEGANGEKEKELAKGSRRLIEFLWDGLHLDSDGNRLVATEIKRVVKTHYPELTPEAVPMILPWSWDLKMDDLEAELIVNWERSKPEL